MYALIFDACSKINNNDVTGLLRQAYAGVVVYQWQMISTYGDILKVNKVIRARFNQSCVICDSIGSKYIGFSLNKFVSIADVYFCPLCEIKDVDNFS